MFFAVLAVQIYLLKTKTTRDHQNITEFTFMIHHVCMNKPMVTCTLDELDVDFLLYPLSIPNSAKKFEDFGGATCPLIWLSSELLPVLAAGAFSTYSNREVQDLLLVIVLSVTDGRTGAGSSGFCS